MDTASNSLSEQILLSVKMEESYQEKISILGDLSLDQLQADLQNDEEKKAFWINIYNAFYQILRKDHGLEKPAIFKNKVIKIAGKDFSLDDIEHGILRKGKHKYSKGYLGNPFTSKRLADLEVELLDYRIHFALNCGAKSCPPIAFYQADRINDQLKMATLSFLESETEVDNENKILSVTALFSWFSADFGGKDGVRNILGAIFDQDFSGFKVQFQTYSWDEDLDNYKEM